MALFLFLIAVAWTASGRAKSGETPQAIRDSPVSPALARDRARMMQEIYLATLTVMHDRYFHSNRAVLPARAMEDVFADVAEATGAEARWIAVNTKAMSVDHQPQTDFEKKAAEALDAGDSEFEEQSEGVYRYAVAVPLGAGCIGCHTGFTGTAPQAPKVAGLVLSIPVNEE